MVEDPTLSVLGKVQDVLDELKVHVSRYDLHELRSSITTLPQTLKDADAVILAVTVEWFGIGGIMQDFLDAVRASGMVGLRGFTVIRIR